ncbi:prepilin peptidase [Saccharothrix syringae]|uniref:Prepilin peptidase n=2 Tax=Saccharothrix syringae TaxID=103733 RepID=A0A5Q0HF76_SACSY|nr:prepilin peptidase [Saccharothrix syringae]
MVGLLLVAPTLRLLTTPPARSSSVRWSIPALTALAFALLAWRFGASPELVPYSVLASGGAALGVIDVMQRRLPHRFLLPSAIGFTSLLLGSTLISTEMSSLFRALAGMATLSLLYLGLALLTSGGLGAGDVKLGGLLGLALGWLGWTPLIMGTLLGWLTATFAFLLLRTTGRWTCDSDIPLGTFLLLGSLVAVSVPT